MAGPRGAARWGVSRLCCDVGDLSAVQVQGDHGGLELLPVDLLLRAVLHHDHLLRGAALDQDAPPSASRQRLSRKPAATSIAMWPLRRGISGRVRVSLAGQRVSVISVLVHSPDRRASAAAATGSTVRVVNRMSPLGVVFGVNEGYGSGRIGSGSPTAHSSTMLSAWASGTGSAFR